MTPFFRAAAVITAYRPGPSLPGAVRSVLDQVHHVVVVDDGSPSGGELIDECEALGATVVRHGVNRGIGAALNTGITTARSSDRTLTHVLTMDQDSALPDGYVEALVRAERAATRAGTGVGMTSPGDVATVRRHRTQGHADFAAGGEPIQSGLLLPVATLDAVGAFDESSSSTAWTPTTGCGPSTPVWRLSWRPASR